MHGVGERGNGTTDMWMVLNTSFPKMLKKGATLTFDVNGHKHAFLVLMPQMSKAYINWQNFYVEEMIKYARASLPVDTNKIFLTGWSLGGGGAWKFPTASPDSANLIAGIIPVAPAPNFTNVANLAKGRVAVWVHQSKDDPSIPISFAIGAVKGTNQCDPEVPARMSYYKYGKHTLVSDIAYDTGNKYVYPNIFQWMIGISRKERKSTNHPPVANAGNDSLLVLPSVSTILDGSRSYDPNDVITGYKWTLMSGPPSPDFHMEHADFPVASVTGLEPGVYHFKLTVADAFGETRADAVTINVALPRDGSNALPYVNLGADKFLSTKRMKLRAAIRDFDGKVTSCTWKQLTGPATLNIQPKMNEADITGFRELGDYTIQVKVEDNANPRGISFDTILITRQPFITPIKKYFSLDSSAQDLYGRIIILLLPILMIVMLLSVITGKKHGLKGWL